MTAVVLYPYQPSLPVWESEQLHAVLLALGLFAWGGTRAIGLRRSELLALRWVDLDAEAGSLAVTGKLFRATGHGDDTTSAAGKRTLPLPQFVMDVPKSRHGRAFVGEQPMIFPSTAGTWRDPNNFGKQWRAVREDLAVPEVITHSFRKTVATLIDDTGLSARAGPTSSVTPRCR